MKIRKRMPMATLVLAGVLGALTALAVACRGGQEAPAAGTVVNVTANDGDKWGFVLDKTSVPAGEVTFVLNDKGKLVHELMVYPKQDLSPMLKELVEPKKADKAMGHSDDKAMGHSDVEIKGLVKSVTGEEGIMVTPGKSGRFTVRLAPGTYELGCLLVETSREGPFTHHEKGMHATITVQ